MADPLIDDIGSPGELRELRGAGLMNAPTSAKSGEDTSTAIEDRRRIQQVQAASLVILATATVLSLMYVAKLVLVVVLTAILMAFVLAPVVDGLARFRVPRSVGAVSYLSYARALDFLSQMPEYRIRLQHIVNEIRMEADRLEKTTETVLPPEPEDKNSVTVRERNSLGNFIGRNMSTFSETALAISFIPFLTYFMLSWQDHVRASSVMLFQMKNRNTAYVTLG